MKLTSLAVSVAAMLLGGALFVACAGTEPPGGAWNGAQQSPSFAVPGRAQGDDVTNGLAGSDSEQRPPVLNGLPAVSFFYTRQHQGGALDLPPFRPGCDELWVIAEGPRNAQPARDRQGPDSGEMFGRDPRGTILPMPLQHTDVHAHVRGYLSVVDLAQRFANPYAEKIEAIYVFPLPDDAAVRDFVMQIGERQIRGVIRKREEARAIYQQAKAQGYRASLLEQARPNVFQQAVANLEPGKAIDIKLRYAHTLSYAADGYEFVFPMVVGPRYNPAGSRDGVGAAPAALPGSSGQPTEVTYLPPELRPGNDVSIEVDVDGGLPIGGITSPSHCIDVDRQAASRATVRLAGGATIPNRDFVLRFQVGGMESAASLFTCSDVTGGYLTLLLQPPAALAQLPRQPLELIFLIDCSGSMSGAPLQQAKAVVELAMSQLGPQDSLQIVGFADSPSAMATAPVPASCDNLLRARMHLASLQSGGGTEMLGGIEAALMQAGDGERRRCVFLLSDGFIGNETQIFTAVRERLGRARMFAVGVGSSVNRFLIEGVARLGRGACGYLLHDEAPGRAVAQLFERIGHPALADVAIDWGSANVREVFPARLPDLFAGRPVVVTARYEGAPPTAVQVSGCLGGRRVAFDAEVAEAKGDALLAALPALWARQKIRSLSDFAEIEGYQPAPARIEQLALQYNLMSPFTSFLAVDGSQRTAGDHGVTLPVPVPMPAGVRYETTVSDR